MEKAMSVIKHDHFTMEAQRYCYEREIDDEAALMSVEYALRHRAFMQAARPLLAAKARISAMHMPTYILIPDGKIEKTDDGLTDAARALLAQYDLLIKAAAASVGLKLSDEVSPITTPCA